MLRRPGCSLSLATAALLCGIAGGTVPRPASATVLVNGFGVDGWRSDDTRNASGVDLVGVNDTNAGKPGQTPTSADDTAIAQQIQFVSGPAGSTYGGALSLDGTISNSGKSNFSVISPTAGFAPAGDLLSSFSATYEWYGMPDPTSRTVAFKIGIQSTEWGTGAGESQNAFTATRSGESAWDLVLVEADAASDNAWSTVNLDPNTGTWLLFRQSGNSFFSVAPSGAKTLAEWATDPDYGSLLFGTGAKVSSVQFGLGSGQKASIAYVDYLQTTLLDGNQIIDFTNQVPEPGSLVLLGTGLFALLGTRRRRRPGTERKAPGGRIPVRNGKP